MPHPAHRRARPAAAGLLAFTGGANVPTVIFTGGGAYAGTVLLLLALAHYARRPR